MGPEVTRVIKSSAFATLGERLAWATCCPDRFVIRPSGQTQSIGPAAKSGEKVALDKSSQVIWCDILNTPFIHNTRRNLTAGD